MLTRAAIPGLTLLLLSPPRAPADDWLVSVEGGRTWTHTDDRSAAAALRVSRRLGSLDTVRLQAGIGVASYGALDVGLEWRPSPGRRVVPFLGVGGGLMGEDEYAGPFLRGTFGLEIALSDRVVARLAAQAGTHDGQRGPHLATLGFGWRF